MCVHFGCGLNSDDLVLLSLVRHCSSVPSSIVPSRNVSDATPCSRIGIVCDTTSQNVVVFNLSNYGISGN